LKASTTNSIQWKKEYELKDKSLKYPFPRERKQRLQRLQITLQIHSNKNQHGTDSETDM
jgi:hypothetical protein